MSNEYDAYEARVRRRAHEIWEREGKPHGRAEDHWELAREEISEQEGIDDTLKPIEAPPIAEPLLAVEGMADLPGRQLDQGEKQDYPSRRTPPKGKAKAAPKAVASKRRSAAL
jgi:hypothetical protein